MVPSLTDNRGNGALLNKLMTTKFPASALLMELSTYMKRMNMRMVVEWAPRDCNREADQLANGITTGFGPAVIELPALVYPGRCASRGRSSRDRAPASSGQG